MLNLYKRILLLIVGLSLGSGIFISVWVGQVLHDRLDEEIGNRGTAITEALTEAVTKNIIAGDSISTLRTLQRVVARNEDIDHAFVVDFDGKLFAHTFEGQFPTHLERMNARWEDLPDQNDHQYTTSRGIIRHISHPLIEGAPGRLSVGFNKSGSAASIEETRREIIFIIFGIALIGAVLASFVGNRVSRPLNMLTETVAAYGRGEQANFGALRNRGGTPETTALRDAFKGMIEFREKSAVENTRLARIVEESLNEIYIFDAETLKFTKVNHGARKNLGYSMDEMRDMTAFDIKPEIGEEQFKEIIQPLKDGAEKQLVFE
ncbi:MAG: PAS domain S-box protein, partial [Alphaproteobacteria bacterium]|nr:PAS domain S-box protein [Alphaproteobacteria bacterium]